jgi:hypothetical protein
MSIEAHQDGKWINDAKYGPSFQREIREGYGASDEMPGATVVPSHKDKLGGQMGQDPHEMMPFVVDPGYPDSVEVDPRLVSRRAAAEAAATGDPLSANMALSRLQNAGAVEEEKALTAQRQKPSGRRPPPKARRYKVDPTQQQPPQPQQPTGGTAVTSAGAPSSTQTARSASRPVRTGAAAGGVSRQAIVDEVMRQIISEPGTVRKLAALAGVELAEDLQQPAGEPFAGLGPEEVHVQPARGPRSSSETLDESKRVEIAPHNVQAAEENPEPPSVRVKIRVPGYGQVVSEYHNVVRDEVALVFIFDMRYQHTSRFYPEPSDQSYDIQIESGEEKAVYKAFYSGVSYRFLHWEFLVFLIDSRQREPQDTE